MAAKGRRWLIYKDSDKNEVASIQDVHDCNEIINRLEKNIQDGMVDIAEKEALIDMIEKSLPQGMSWPRNYCINILLRALEKFEKTAKSKEFFHDESLYKAFEWIVDNDRTLKKWHSSGEKKPDRNAFIKCDDIVKDGIKTDLFKMLLDVVQSFLNDPKRDKRDVHVIGAKSGLEVFYPVGELYGYTNDYAESVVGVLGKIKKKHKSIGIQGSVYYFDQISSERVELMFNCEPDDKGLAFKRTYGTVN